MSDRMRPIEHYDAAVSALKVAVDAAESAAGTAAAAAVAEAHLHAADLLLRIEQAGRWSPPAVHVHR